MKLLTPQRKIIDPRRPRQPGKRICPRCLRPTREWARANRHRMGSMLLAICCCEEGCPSSVFITVADVVRCTTCMLRNTFTGGATAVDMLAVNGTFEVPFVEDQIANSVCRYFGEIDTGSNVIEITQYNDCCVTPSTPGSYNAETTIIQFDLLWSYLHNVWIFIEVSPDVGPDGAFLYGDVGGTTGVAYDEAATNERTVSDCNKPCDGFSTYSTSGYGGTAVISRNAP